MTRPDWDTWFLRGAEWASERGACSRSQVGAMVIDPETHDIIEPGYNGAPSGHPDCLDGACPRGRHYLKKQPFHRGTAWGELDHPGYCACGNPWPCPEAVAPGSSYDNCIAVHAESNALLRAGRRSRGAWMYLTRAPCHDCRKLIMGAGIAQVVWMERGVKRTWVITTA